MGLRLKMLQKMQQLITRAILKATEDDSRTRAQVLTDAACRVFGFKAMKWDSREASFVWGRAFVAYELYTEGMTETEIGEALQRDRSTVNHLKRKMLDMLSTPEAFKDVAQKWDKFKNEIR